MSEVLNGVTGRFRRLRGSFTLGPWLIGIAVLSPVPLLSGNLYQVHLVTYIHPENFNILIMITFLVMVVPGGLGHIWGGVIGATLVTLIHKWTRPCPEYRVLMFGTTAVLVLIYMPKGIGGLPDRFFATRRFLAIRAVRTDASAD